VRFRGAGASPAAKHLSLRRDLAACTSLFSVFDHASWPLCSCLVAISISASTRCEHGLRPLDFAPNAYCTIPVSFLDLARSALSTTCLEDLTMRETPPEVAPQLAFLSNLSSLSRISISCCSPLHAASQLPALPLHLPSHLLPLLTRAHLHGIRIDSRLPMALGAVQALELDDCSMDSLHALSGCPMLTRLKFKAKGAALTLVDGGDLLLAAGGAGAGGRGPILEKLCSLQYSALRTPTMGWVAQLRGLTSLFLDVVDVGPNLCRCAGVAGGCADGTTILRPPSLCGANAGPARCCASTVTVGGPYL
jgi:hypothetical protein